MKTNSISSQRAPSGAALPRVSASAAAQNPRAPSAAAKKMRAPSGATPRAEAPTFNSRRQAGKGAVAPLSGSARALPSCGDSRSTASSRRSALSSGSAATLSSRSSGDTLNFRAPNGRDTLCSPPSPWKLLADRCGLSEVTLRNAFARKPITWQTACRIAKNLEIQAASFRIKPDRRGRKK